MKNIIFPRMDEDFVVANPEVAELLRTYEAYSPAFLTNDSEMVEYPQVGAVLLRGVMNPAHTESMVLEAESAGFEHIVAHDETGNVIDDRHAVGTYCMGARTCRNEFGAPHKRAFINEVGVWTRVLVSKWLERSDGLFPHENLAATSPSVLTGLGEGGLLISPEPSYGDLEKFQADATRIPFGASDLLFISGALENASYTEGDDVRYLVSAHRIKLSDN